MNKWGCEVTAFTSSGSKAEEAKIPGAHHVVGTRKSISGSPLGSPATVATMLDFCARHSIAPVIETFPMADVNAAIDHLRAGKARQRVVLSNG